MIVVVGVKLCVCIEVCKFDVLLWFFVDVVLLCVSGVGICVGSLMIVIGVFIGGIEVICVVLE